MVATTLFPVSAEVRESWGVSPGEVRKALDQLLDMYVRHVIHAKGRMLPFGSVCKVRPLFCVAGTGDLN